MYRFNLFVRWLVALALALSNMAPAFADTILWQAASSLATAREKHTATVLSSGKVLVAGGSVASGSNGAALASAELYDPTNNTWAAARSMTIARTGHTATLLPSGKVLAVGGSTSAAASELYDPANDTWTLKAPLLVSFHTATLLSSGKVLVVGGVSQYFGSYGLPNAGAALYDPSNDKWTAAGQLTTARASHTATLLPSGQVLVVGGTDTNVESVSSAELYDPSSNTWTSAGRLIVGYGRAFHTATLLSSGKVLVVGGKGIQQGIGEFPQNSAELYDPISNTWSQQGSMSTPRAFHTATLLPSGALLVTGGMSNTNHIEQSSELYDPGNGTWSIVGTLATARAYHTATLLPTGLVVVVGGQGIYGTPLTSAERYEHYAASAGKLIAASPLLTARNSHTATLLPTGKALVIGGSNSYPYVGESALSSAESYDTISDTWSHAASMAIKRMGHTATLLPSGKVLVVGGFNSTRANNSPYGTVYGALSSVETYDPSTNTWSEVASMAFERSGHSATLLPSGKVLVVGGSSEILSSTTASYTGTGFLASAELYDPASDTWTSVAPMLAPRAKHTATLLRSGQVLVVGGVYGSLSGSTNRSAIELYDPASNSWSTKKNTLQTLSNLTATLLPSGKVLVVGVTSSYGATEIEVYDPTIDTWVHVPAPLSGPFVAHSATLLPSGQVLVFGGGAGLYDPITGTWALFPSSPLYFHTATVLLSGQVLLAGGCSNQSDCQHSLVLIPERFDPGFTVDYARIPNVFFISPYLLPTSSPLAGAFGSSNDGNGKTTATGFLPRLEGGGGATTASASNAPILQVQRVDNDQMMFVPNDETVSWKDTLFTGSPSAFANFPAGPVRVRAWVNGVPSATFYSTLAVTPGVTRPVAVGGNLKATVMFSAGDNGGTAITRYIATAQPGGAQASCSAPCNSLAFTGIAAGTYTFQVAAINAAGTGPAIPSNSVIVTNNHTVTPSVTGNGSISPNMAQPVNDGSTATFTVAPTAGNYLVDVTGSCGGSLVGTTFTTNVIKADCTVIANFAMTKTYTVTPSVMGNGTISPSTPVIVDDGTTTTFTMTPAIGNQLLNVMGTCGGSLVGTTYTTNAITADCTVVANFATAGLVFTTQPVDVQQDTALGTIVVTEMDSSSNVLADNATVDFVIQNVCGATLDLGSVAMNNGVATLNSTQRFHTVAGGLMISATTPTLSGSTSFNVVANSDYAFSGGGFEGCQP